MGEVGTPTKKKKKKKWKSPLFLAVFSKSGLAEEKWVPTLLLIQNKTVLSVLFAEPPPYIITASLSPLVKMRNWVGETHAQTLNIPNLKQWKKTTT